MKLNLLFSLLLFSFTIQSAEVRVTHMQLVPEYDTRYNLTTNLEQKVVLDCQSFIQGLFLGESGVEQTVMLEEWECAELGERMADSHRLKRSHCLDLDVDRLTLNSHQGCD